jgi:hypothetical protein
MNCCFCQSQGPHVSLHPYQGEVRATCAWVCDDCLGDVPKGLTHHYLRSRLVLKNSHNMALMFVTGQAPRLKTNTTWLSGFGDNGKQFEGQEYAADEYRRHALAHGVDPKGKVYISQLAEYPGDPNAWVSDRDEVFKKAELKGWGAEGEGRKLEAADRPPPAEIPLAPEIVEERLIDHFMDHPDPRGVTEKDIADAREAIIEKHTPSWGEVTADA